ncbi:MAG: thiamine diphosphokinase [Spirochaetales bacterium]|nr:thiamine diphosphokinase [Spirochaetales bacterium]
MIVQEVKACNLIIAADSGFDTLLRCGLIPDYVIGDMDSVTRKKELKKIDPQRVILHPPEKDDTDTDLAVMFAHGLGADTIVLVGGGGGRIDHLMGILSLFDREIHPQRWFTDKEILESVDGNIEVRGMAGTRVSFFPVGTEVCTMESSGLQWPLDPLTWKKGDAGISNVITRDVMKVTMKTGRLLMVRDIALGAE